jgi:hypothetical protein
MFNLPFQFTRVESSKSFESTCVEYVKKLCWISQQAKGNISQQMHNDFINWIHFYSNLGDIDRLIKSGYDLLRIGEIYHGYPPNQVLKTTTPIEEIVRSFHFNFEILSYLLESGYNLTISTHNTGTIPCDWIWSKPISFDIFTKLLVHIKETQAKNIFTRLINEPKPTTPLHKLCENSHFSSRMLDQLLQMELDGLIWLDWAMKDSYGRPPFYYLIMKKFNKLGTLITSLTKTYSSISFDILSIEKKDFSIIKNRMTILCAHPLILIPLIKLCGELFLLLDGIIITQSIANAYSESNYYSRNGCDLSTIDSKFHAKLPKRKGLRTKPALRTSQSD